MVLSGEGGFGLDWDNVRSSQLVSTGTVWLQCRPYDGPQLTQSVVECLQCLGQVKLGWLGLCGIFTVVAAASTSLTRLSTIAADLLISAMIASLVPRSSAHYLMSSLGQLCWSVRVGLQLFSTRTRREQRTTDDRRRSLIRGSETDRRPP